MTRRDRLAAAVDYARRLLRHRGNLAALHAELERETHEALLRDRWGSLVDGMTYTDMAYYDRAWNGHIAYLTPSGTEHRLAVGERTLPASYLAHMADTITDAEGEA